MALIKDLDETQAPLVEHLAELRTRLVRALVFLGIGFAICLPFADVIFGWLVLPLRSAFAEGQGQLIFTKLYEQFFVDMKVALFAGFLLSFPFIANQLWAFVAPGLYAKEKKAFLPFLLATPVLFLSGASLAYFVVMPTAFKWFLGFQGERGGLTVEALPAVGDYLALVMRFIIVFGVSFLLPVFLLLLNRAGIVERAQLAKARRYVIVGIVTVAAIITPPDVFSQILLAVPLFLLFEGSLVLMRLSERKRDRQASRKPTPDMKTGPNGPAFNSNSSSSLTG